jgi:hypothetical protein
MLSGMRPTVQRPRFRRTRPTVRPHARAALPAVKVIRVRSVPAPVLRAIPVEVLPHTDNFLPDAHVDYARTLTPEGGVVIAYKDFDRRWRHVIARVVLWSVASGSEGWILLRHSPLHNPWISIACLLVVVIINWLIVSRPVEIHRSVEIRPDCMIIDGKDLFWTAKMESWPAFESKDDHYVLGGIYGTRFVEYLTTCRVDEFDRTPDVLAAHLQQATQQMWTRPF